MRPPSGSLFFPEISKAFPSGEGGRAQRSRMRSSSPSSIAKKPGQTKFFSPSGLFSISKTCPAAVPMPSPLGNVAERSEAG